MIKKSKYIPDSRAMINHLTDDEFDSLFKVVYFLQVPQVKYILDKFSIPIRDDETNIFNVLLLSFQTLRHDSLLGQIYHEIQNLKIKNETNFIQKMLIVQINPCFESPLNYFNDQSNPPFIFGPISILSGRSSGQFKFECKSSNFNSDTLVNISFLFFKRIPHQFSLECEFNESPIEVSIDDPYPQPIDITDLILFDSNINYFDIKMINSPQPFMICIREYTFNNIENIMEKIVGRPVNIDEEDFNVYSKKCNHNGSYSLTKLISSSFATGEWKCPICSQIIDPLNLVVY